MPQMGFRTAKDDFRNARRKAAIQRLLATLKRESVDLVPFEEVSEQFILESTRDVGVKIIPLDAIVGSVGRYQEFTRSFLPLGDEVEERWLKVKAFIERSGMMPIKVFQLGDVYFVSDGNHRVSVARQLGHKTIQAEVTEVDTDVPMDPENSPEEIICKVRYADFLKKTYLAKLRPESNLSMTFCDQFHVLLEHIEAHHYLLAHDTEREDIPYEEAVLRWHDTAYQPALRLIRDQGLQKYFPGKTDADLYVLVTKHRNELEERLSWPVDMVAVASDLAKQGSRVPGQVIDRFGEQLLDAVTPDALEAGPAPGKWRQDRLAKRSSDILFADILVSCRGKEFDNNLIIHAAKIAQKEAGRLFGLCVVKKVEKRKKSSITETGEAFLHTCRQIGIRGEFATEVGKTARKIVERAAWVDLVALSLTRKKRNKADTGFGTGFQKIIQRSPRPILVVPENANSSFERALLAYDGSPKADEALYLAAYLANHWRLSLTVLSAGKESANMALERARDYMTKCRVEVEYIAKERPAVNAILSVASDLDNDLIIMGGFGYRPLFQIFVGSTVLNVLKNFDQPVLICR